MPNLDDRLFGDWQLLAGVLAGSELAGEIVSATKLTINEGVYSVNLAGTIDSGSCDIKLDENLIKLHIEGTKGPNAGKTFLAILQFLNDEQIRIAYDLSGNDYPDSFNPTENETSYVATFKKC